MVMRDCRVCAFADAAPLANASTLRPTVTARRTTLIIDRDAPGNAADRNRNQRLATLRIDHRDVVAEAVRHVKLALVPRQRGAPRSFADEDVALHLAHRH